MRKLSALILALILVLSFTGCGEKREVEYAKAPEASVPEKGTIEGNVYTGALSGLVFNKPEGWVYATDEEIASVEAPEGVFYDMMCQDPVTGSQVAVMYEELLITAGNIAVTADKYIEGIGEGLYNSGMEIYDEKDYELGGKTYKSVTVYGESEDISVMQCSLARKEGSKMISVVAVAFNGESVEDILNYFE